MMTTPIDNNMNKNMALSDKDILMTGISKSAIRWVIASLSLILFTTIICLSYSIGVNDAEQGAIPIIRADGTAVKVRPDNPGGRQYPHQDLTIYNSFRDDISEKNNHLKDNLEKPMASMPTQDTNQEINEASQDSDTVNTLKPQDDVVLETVSQTPKTKIQKPIMDNKISNSEAQINTIVNNNTIQSELQKQHSQQPEMQKTIVPPQPTVAPVVTGGNFLQIGAYRSQADAVAGFNRAKSKFSGLSNAGYNIVKVDLGTKGIYYRLRVGPFANKEQSLAFCSKLQSQGQPCLYVSR